jgi:F420-0:gamma-glutamyl ligase
MPPKDSLTEALSESRLALKDGDIVAISSKVISIQEGRCIPIEGVDRKKLIKQETSGFIWLQKLRAGEVFSLFQKVRSWAPQE